MRHLFLLYSKSLGTIMDLEGILSGYLTICQCHDGDDHPARACLHMASRQKRSLLYARGGSHTHLNGISCID